MRTARDPENLPRAVPSFGGTGVGERRAVRFCLLTSLPIVIVFAYSTYLAFSLSTQFRSKFQAKLHEGIFD